MHRPIPIDVNFISKLTGLPTDGVNIEQCIDDKTRRRLLNNI
jgi:hypothetical protein